MSDTSNTIRIACPHCKVVLETDASVEGTRVACPECGREFVASRKKPSVVQADKPKSKKKFVLGIAILAVALLCMRTSCSGGHSNGDKMDAVKAQVVRTYNQEFSAFESGINQEVLWDGDTIVINLSHDAVTMSALFAASGAEPFVGLWNTLKIKMMEASYDALGIAFSQGIDIHVLCNLLDSTDTGTPLLSILDGTIIYDATLQ